MSKQPAAADEIVLEFGKLRARASGRFAIAALIGGTVIVLAAWLIGGFGDFAGLGSFFRHWVLSSLPHEATARP
jgi:hypothetical protein